MAGTFSTIRFTPRETTQDMSTPTIFASATEISPLILLNPEDTVAIARKSIPANTQLQGLM